MHGKEGNEWLDRASHLCIIMSINCYSRLFEQQLLLFFSIAAMLTCSMTDGTDLYMFIWTQTICLSNNFYAFTLYKEQEHSILI